MCSQTKSPTGKRSELTLDDYEKIARDGARLGAVSVNILGGEPLVYKNIAELIGIFAKHGYFVWLVSNSVLATKDRLKQLRAAGLNSICFSLDSMQEERNDEIRSLNGHFKKVFEAVENAKQAGLMVNLAPVFLPGKMKDAIDVIKYCIDNGLGASATQAAPVGSFENEAVLSPDEHDQIRQLLRDYPRLTLDWSLSYFLEQRCPAGKEKIGITNYGDVIACSINPIAFGNLRRESLSSVLKRMGNFSQFRKNSTICLAAEDPYYVDNFIRPLAKVNIYPVLFSDHPKITPETEPELFE
jgi:MoaA/NifB/PqqE/SkfB family radical SAM enzyme